MPQIQLIISGDTATAVTITSLTDPNGSTPSGVTPPVSMTYSGGAWSFSFTGTALYYNYSYTIVWTDTTDTTAVGTIAGDSTVGTNNYASLSDFQSRYDLRQIAQLSSDDDSGTLLAVNAQEALNDAASELDSYLTNRVSLPIPAPVPGILVRYVCSHAWVAMYARRGDVPASVQADYAASEKWVNDFIMGKVSIPGSARAGISLIQSDSYDQASITNGIPFFPNDPNNPNGPKGFGG